MNISDFPKSNMQFYTAIRLNKGEIEERKKILRNVASNFTRRKDVRDFIFNNKGRKCYICGAESTQIDHKISVFQFAINKKLDYRQMNSYDNLFPICEHCNAAKQP